MNFAKKTVGGFNYEFTRGVSTQMVGAAEFGECMETMHRIENGDFESWIREWSATADHVKRLRKQPCPGDPTAARIAFLKASNYYRMAVFYAKHTDPRHRTLWEQSRACLDSMIALADTRMSGSRSGSTVPSSRPCSSPAEMDVAPH